jgi:hypothetical protein
VLAHALLYFVRDKEGKHMKLTNRLFRSLCMSTIAVFAYANAAQAQPGYTITPIGPIPTTFDVRYDAHGLNNKGEVAGTVVTNQNYRGFFWRDGEITVIQPITPDTQYMEAFAINDRSQVVGTSGFRPFLWQDGTTRDIGFFPGQFGIFPSNVNNWGQTTGTAAVNFEDLPYLSTGDSAVMLEALPGEDGTQGVGQVNNLGVAVGVSGPFGARHPVVWFTGSSTPYPLNLLPGVTNANASVLNDVGRIIVNQDLPDKGTRFTVWNLGNYTVLPGLHGEDVATLGYNLNNVGQYTGTSFDSSTGTTEYVVWDHGTAYRVKDLIASSDPLKPFVEIVSIGKINDRGQILVAGIDSRGVGIWSYFLLTPVKRH